MNSQNIVVFKGKKNGITIMLDASCDFEEMKTVLGEKVIDAKKFFGGAKSVITFQGRQLSDDEEAELLNIIAQKANLNISFVSDDVYKAAPPSQKNIEKQLEQPISTYSSQLFSREHITKFHGGSLRSGQAIRFAGSVVVLGDVNPGAEIIAEGNIIVLGAAKGLVHAGCTGNTDCFVSAVVMMPTQLRIADIITCIPKEMARKSKDSLNPCYAYIKSGQIYIAPLVNA